MSFTDFSKKKSFTLSRPGKKKKKTRACMDERQKVKAVASFYGEDAFVLTLMLFFLLFMFMSLSSNLQLAMPEKEKKREKTCIH